MLLLSSAGWYNGISALFVVIVHTIVGFFFINTSRKTNAKLLFYAGIMIICVGFMWLGLSLDFITVLLTNNNLTLPYYGYFLIAWMWSPIAGIFGVYVGAELLIPEKKKYIVTIFIGLVSIVFIFFLFYPEDSVNVIIPDKPGEYLIEHAVKPGSLVSYFIITIIIFSLSFNGIGTLIRGIRSNGLIRKKFLYLSIYFFFSIIFIILEGFIIAPGAAFIFKVGIIGSLWFFYEGLKEEPEEAIIISTKPKKEIKIEDGLFRIIKKTDIITEEEVIFHREQKICLVCKGKTSGYNVFICPICSALYCVKCAHALENLENVCWVCNTPINNSKPSKPIEKEELEQHRERFHK